MRCLMLIRRGQSVVEYLLLLTIVGVLVFLAMKPGGVVDQVQTRGMLYYNKASDQIKNR